MRQRQRLTSGMLCLLAPKFLEGLSLNKIQACDASGPCDTCHAYHACKTRPTNAEHRAFSCLFRAGLCKSGNASATHRHFAILRECGTLFKGGANFDCSSSDSCSWERSAESLGATWPASGGALGQLSFLSWDSGSLCSCACTCLQ